MSPITGNQLLEQLRWRYATKDFDPQKKISGTEWAILEEALVLSPSGLNLQPWKFFVIDDPAVRQKLLPATYGQTQVVTASHVVVLAGRLHYGEADLDRQIRRTAEVRGQKIGELAGYRDMSLESVVRGRDENGRRIWIDNQVHIALGNLLASAALLGIDACPMGGFVAEQYDAILGLKEKGWTAVVVAALGYRAASDTNAALAKVRFPREEQIERI